MKRITTIALATIASATIAQAALVVSASIDSTMLMLGDQATLHLEAQCAPGEQVQWPQLGETLIDEIEIVSRTPIDTTTLDDGRVCMAQDMQITSWNDSLFSIAPLPFVDGSGNTIYSQPMSLNVIQPFELDTTMAITDIKGNEDAPIWWWGILRWVLLGVLLVALIGLVGWLVWYLKRKQAGELIPAVPERPAEEVALEKLDHLRAEQLWQQGQQKAYHSELTLVIREYIARRFDVRSTEKTSDETLRELRPLLADRKELYEALEKELKLADLVKFAKWHAYDDENEQALATAYRFVHETTPPVKEEMEN